MSSSGYEIKTGSNGSKFWYLNGELHREGGPAVEDSDGSKSWYLNGKLHREDGPAIECSTGTKHWYLNDEYYSEEDWKAKIESENLKMEEIGHLFEPYKVGK